MAITLTDSARNAMAAALTALVNGGSIQFQTSGNSAVATLALSATAFGAPSAGVATANTITSDADAVGGTIAKAIFRNSSGTEIFRGTVTVDGGGGDITGPTLVIPAHETVAITSLTITMPAS